jgi:hypothetical protein
MFNAGVISSKQLSPVYVVGKELSVAANLAEVYFYQDGSMGGGYGGYVGWYRNRPLTGIGNNYQIRAVNEAGIGLEGNPSPVGAWRKIAGNSFNYDYTQGAGGRFRIEIRDATTLVVVATAKFWTPGYAP